MFSAEESQSHMWPEGARHSTAQMTTSYLAGRGRIAGNAGSRTGFRRMIRDHLRVAQSKEEIARVMRVWREVHYLGRSKGPAGGASSVFQPKVIRIHWYLDLPVIRPIVGELPWYPAAAITIRYALPGGIPGHLNLESPMQALEVTRCFGADDLREQLNDFMPAVLRAVVARMSQGTEWQSIVRGRVKWPPLWLLTFSDPAMGHDGGLYRGAGAQHLGELVSGKDVWGWELPNLGMENGTEACHGSPTGDVQMRWDNLLAPPFCMEEKGGQGSGMQG